MSMSDGGEKVGILYWGSRGGGKILTDQLIMEAKRQNLEVINFSRPYKKNSDREFISIWLFRRWLKARKEVITDSVKSQIDVMIIPMASPWDIFLGKRLIRVGIKVTRIIHDAKPHPGDTFPPKFWIRALCNDSSRVVALSKYVSEELSLLRYLEKTEIRVGKLPYPEIIPNVPFNNNLPRRNFLFIGRGRAYKGLDLLSARIETTSPTEVQNDGTFMRRPFIITWPWDTS